METEVEDEEGGNRNDQENGKKFMRSTQGQSLGNGNDFTRELRYRNEFIVK